MEILAPAGNFASLKAAVYSGANAVYLGMGNFNARVKADNFSEDNLAEAVKFAHIYGVKVYCAFNTLIKNEELSDVLNAIKFADNCKVDAIIVQDLGLIDALNLTMPHIVKHASTQMGIHNLEGAKAIAQLGIKRVILSRETLLEDIIKIHNGTDLEIEFFVHGALCVAFSGNCYFSSLVSGYSGNRGKCMQLCRKKYTLLDGDKKKSGYYLSTKDLCLIEDLKTLEDAGITSIKIEGRMRSPEYVGECVRIYKKAIDGNFTKNDIDDLKTVFNRGEFCKAHLYKVKGSVVFPSIQNNIGLRVGTVKSVKKDIAELDTVKKLCIGDGVKYLRDGEEVGYGLITNNNQTTTFKGDLRVADEIRLTSSKALVEDIENREFKLGIMANICLHLNEPPEFTLRYKDLIVTVHGDSSVELAQKQPLTIEGVRNSLSKFGGTYFNVDSMVVEIDENIFYPVGKINNIRRDAQLKLEEEICKKYLNKESINGTTLRIDNNNWLILPSPQTLFIQISNINVEKKLIDIADFVIFAPSKYEIEPITEFKKIYGHKAVLNLPLIARGKDIEILKNIIENAGIEIFVVNNLYALDLCKNKTLIAGHGLNLLNDNLNITKINSIESENYKYSNNNILYAYGYETFMTLCHCPRFDLQDHCKNCNDNTKLKLIDDRNEFDLRRIKIDNCYWQVNNTIPLNLMEEARKMHKCNMLIDFTNVADNVEIKSVLQGYVSGGNLSKSHTHGNYNKKLY